MTLTVKRLLVMLREEYGDPHWWPGESPFEIAVGAILTQRAAWKNTEMAIANLRKSKMLSPQAIVGVDQRTLEFKIKPSGFYKQKAKYLAAFAGHLEARYQGKIKRMSSVPVEQLREELLALPGIGPETADSILLYALNMPSFVIDAYTVRLIDRLGLKVGADYGAIKRKFEKALRGNTRDYSDMHALIVIHCKERCRAIPECSGCPLGTECRSKRNQQ